MGNYNNAVWKEPDIYIPLSRVCGNRMIGEYTCDIQTCDCVGAYDTVYQRHWQCEWNGRHERNKMVFRSHLKTELFVLPFIDFLFSY